MSLLIHNLHPAPFTIARFSFIAAWRRRARILKLQKQVAILRMEYQRICAEVLSADAITMEQLEQLSGIRAQRLMLEGELARELGN
jgi:hypothetical protein